MNNKKNTLCLLGFVILLLEACTQNKTSENSAIKTNGSIEQSSICETKEWRKVPECHLGQKVAFLPDSWGNQQLPILFVAANCDMRYSVALNEGGVVCIYHPISPADSKP